MLKFGQEIDNLDMAKFGSKPGSNNRNIKNIVCRFETRMKNSWLYPVMLGRTNSGI